MKEKRSKKNMSSGKKGPERKPFPLVRQEPESFSQHRPFHAPHLSPAEDRQGEKSRRHFRHYLFDFFMLFLAVVSGFFVDNLREHYVETEREKQFIHSMVDDLNADIHQIDSILARRNSKQQMIDSMLFILASPDMDRYGNQLYYYARWMPRINRIYNNDGTMTQLKNAGNLRLIRSMAARKSMMEYDQQNRFWSNIEEREESLIQQYYPVLKTMFDARVFEKMVNGMSISRPKDNPQLLWKDRTHINELYSQVHFLKNVNTFQIEFGQNRLNQAKSVLAVLKSEYHL
jgi:hypothetical protein